MASAKKTAKKAENDKPAETKAESKAEEPREPDFTGKDVSFAMEDQRLVIRVAGQEGHVDQADEVRLGKELSRARQA